MIRKAMGINWEATFSGIKQPRTCPAQSVSWYIFSNLTVPLKCVPLKLVRKGKSLAPHNIRSVCEWVHNGTNIRQPTLRQRTFRQRTFRQNRQGGHFANLIFFSSKLRSYYHKPHDNDSTKVLYNKISNTLVLCRCISLESSCTTYI